MTELALFNVAKEALAEAVKVDEVKDVRDQAERIRLYGRQAGDRSIIADATVIILRAERRLGELLRSAHETGQLGIGRPSRSNLATEVQASIEEVDAEEAPKVERFTLKEAGISKSLARRSQQFAGVSEGEFEDLVKSARDKIVAGSAVVLNPQKDLSTSQKKARRADRERELGQKIMALPDAKFGVIYADPEWRFETRSDGGLDRAADNHYPTSELAAIKARDVGSLAADDCVLFLWVTVPMLVEGLDVMQAWGFKYVTNFAWIKGRMGTGYWNRNEHELLLVGTRGAVVPPAMGEQYSSVIDEVRGEHSAKPIGAYDIIESYYPTLPKIELNARIARPGWVRWGYEAPETEKAPLIDYFALDTADLDRSRTLVANCIECRARIYDGDSYTVTPEDKHFCDRCFKVCGVEPAPGRLTREEAAPILRARYQNEPAIQLAAELGIPVNTLRNWAFKLGLTSKARLAEMARERNRQKEAE